MKDESGWTLISGDPDTFASITSGSGDEQSVDQPERTLQYYNPNSWSPLSRGSNLLPRVWRFAHFSIFFRSGSQGFAVLPPPDDSISILSSNERMDAISEFFTSAESRILNLPPASAEPHLSSNPTHTLRRVDTKQSVVSLWTIRAVADVSLPLDNFASLIARHPSLQSIEIISSEAYRRTHQGITHRFLVLELRRLRKPTVWLRLDRRPQDGAIFSADKGTLIQDSTRENLQKFDRSVTLDDLRHLIVIILQELVVYQLWPGHAAGSFVDGSLKWGDTAHEVRKRVRERVRRVYHIPRLPTTFEILASFDNMISASDLAFLSKNPWTSSEELSRAPTIASGLATTHDLNEIASRLNARGHVGPSITTRQHLLIIARELVRLADMAGAGQKTPLSDTTSLSSVILQVRPYFHELGKQLEASGAFSDAIMTYREALALSERVDAHYALAKSQLIEILFCLGKALHENTPDDRNEALSLLRRSVMLGNTSQGPQAKDSPIDHANVTRLSYLGSVLLAAHAYPEAARLFAQAAPDDRRTLFDSPLVFTRDFLTALERWGKSLLAAKESDEMFRDGLKIAAAHRRSRMRDNQSLFDRMGALLFEVGNGLYLAHKLHPAVGILEDTTEYMLAGAEDGLTVDRSILTKAFELLASSLFKLGRFADVTPPLEAWRRLQLEEGPSENRNRNLAKIFAMLGIASRKEGYIKHAADAFGEATDFARRLPPETIDPNHPQIPFLAQCLLDWAGVLERCGKRNEAEKALHGCLAIMRPLINEHPRHFRNIGASVLSTMAELLDRQGRVEDSIPFYRESVALTRVDDNSDDPAPNSGRRARELAMRVASLGSALQRSSYYDKSLPVLQEAVMRLRGLVAEPQLNNDTDLQETFGWVLLRTGMMLYYARSPRQALASLEESLDLFKVLSATNKLKSYEVPLKSNADYLRKVVNSLRDSDDEELNRAKELLEGLEL
ncbi:TPR-like protein [Clavulina sp. PMI_390]|nr:TPR-like protein [Clavulina sp. PMI_390]